MFERSSVQMWVKNETGGGVGEAIDGKSKFIHIDRQSVRKKNNNNSKILLINYTFRF
jgi:hypothetical protein